VETSKGKVVLEQYNILLLKHVQPIGTIVPLELMFVSGVAMVLLYVCARFLGSFADEAGKIAARKLLDEDNKNAKECNMTVKEYQFLKNQVVILIENDEEMVSSLKKLKKN
jgi:phosphate uptake regulator